MEKKGYHQQGVSMQRICFRISWSFCAVSDVTGVSSDSGVYGEPRNAQARSEPGLDEDEEDIDGVECADGFRRELVPHFKCGWIARLISSTTCAGISTYGCV